MDPAATLGLNVRSPAWWQLATSAFVFESCARLYETVFVTYVIGRLVEHTHGALGLWAAFIGATVGANAATLAAVSKGALTKAAAAGSVHIASPGGVIGLVVLGLLIPRVTAKPLEVAVLLPFLLTTLAARCVPMAGLTLFQGVKVGVAVHMAGACAGTLAVWALLRLVRSVQARVEEERRAAERQRRQQQQAEHAEAVSDVINKAAKAASRVAKELF